MPTPDSSILAPPSARPEQAIAYIVERGSVYDPGSIRTIVSYYWQVAPAAGVDPVLAIAQCIHETGDYDPASGRWRPLSSWWAQRPRRNPAGLGVTGAARMVAPPDPRRGWVFDERIGMWREGLSFPSWEVSSRAHIGRLLAYALSDAQLTTAQIALLKESLAWRPFPAELRGSAPTLKRLGACHNPTGRGWAQPGDRYGEKIAVVAQEIAAHR